MTRLPGKRFFRKLARNLRAVHDNYVARNSELGPCDLVFYITKRLRYRELLAVANTFALGGYNIRFLLHGRDCLQKLMWFDLQTFIGIPRFKFLRGLPTCVKGATLATDDDSSGILDYDWGRIYHMNFDIPSFRRDPGGSHLFPYPMHPNLYLQYRDHERLADYRSEPKRVRLLFSGNLGSGYGRGKVYDGLRMLTRGDAVQSILAENLARVVRSQDELGRALEGSAFPEFLLVDTSKCKVGQESWLKTVASCEFLLCLPGVVMPMCHAPVEAMAVGTIPLLNYGDWFFPPLDDGQNCVAFDSSRSLKEAVGRILNMSGEDISKMRVEALQYYEKHLSPLVTFERLRNVPDREVALFHYADAYIDE